MGDNFMKRLFDEVIFVTIGEVSWFLVDYDNPERLDNRFF